MTLDCIVCEQIRKENPGISDGKLGIGNGYTWKRFILNGSSYCELHLISK